jgi:hypothetical protein
MSILNARTKIEMEDIPKSKVVVVNAMR